jgi:N-succinyldiaminopimelate aminotransferase
MAPPVQAASVAAWSDEAHVVENRNQYREKFALITPLLRTVLDVELPDAGFYLWADVSRTHLTDEEFALRLYERQHVTVLPGSYLARTAHGTNPGAQRVRMALVSDIDDGLEAAQRIVQFCSALKPA